MPRIPPPPSPWIRVGPVRVSGYSTCVAVGITLAATLAQRSLRKRGGPARLVRETATIGLPAGLAGGRLYHAATSRRDLLSLQPARLRELVRLSSGGLGSWGAIAGAAAGSWVVCRRRGVPMPVYFDAWAPHMVWVVIGVRLGNWFNQEIYGRPTGVAWSQEIDREHREKGIEHESTFHPVGLYESLGAVVISPIVMVARRHGQLGHGRAFALWLGLYSALRCGLEFVRVDRATEVGGVRINVWVSTATATACAAYVVTMGRVRPGIEHSPISD